MKATDVGEKTISLTSENPSLDSPGRLGKPLNPCENFHLLNEDYLIIIVFPLKDYHEGQWEFLFLW